MVSSLDIGIIIFYLAAIVFVSYKFGKKISLEGFLVNRRKTRAIFIIFSIVSTSAGMGLFLGITAATYESGISATLLLLIVDTLAFIFGALFAFKIKNFGDKFKAHTFGDFFGIRYSISNRILVGSILIITYFIWTAVQVIGIAGIASIVTGVNLQFLIIFVGLITILYTTLGGIKVDIYTDALQFLVITFVLLLVLSPIIFIKIGGVGGFLSLPKEFFNPYAFFGSEANALIFFIGSIFVGIPYFLVSAEVWQRIYASDTARNARKSLLLSAFIFIPFILIAFVIGTGAFILLPNEDSNLVLFKLMDKLLPAGLLGLGLAGLLAVAMSTIDTMLLVGSSTILKDFYKSVFSKDASEEKMLKMVRIFTFIFGLGGLVVALAYTRIIQLVILGTFALIPLAPAVIGGLIWKRSTAKAAFWSVLIGELTTFSLIGIMPRTSFVPGLILSIVIFAILSLFTKHSKSEKIF